jgi:hypothetical protein
VKWKKSKEEGAAAGLLDHRYLFPMVGLAPLLIDDQGNPADNENAISFGRWALWLLTAFAFDFFSPHARH